MAVHEAAADVVDAAEGGELVADADMLVELDAVEAALVAAHLRHEAPHHGLRLVDGTPRGWLLRSVGCKRILRLLLTLN